jgi:hypothetical protein
MLSLSEAVRTVREYWEDLEDDCPHYETFVGVISYLMADDPFKTINMPLIRPAQGIGGIEAVWADALGHVIRLQFGDSGEVGLHGVTDKIQLHLVFPAYDHTDYSGALLTAFRTMRPYFGARLIAASWRVLE